nr:MAG TPA: hypothetical protein [Caudoviricetes sp.]
MLLFIRLAVEEGRTLQKNSFIKLFIYFASAGTTSGIPASFLYRNRKEGKERGRGKIGIITHVCTYMRT